MNKQNKDTHYFISYYGYSKGASICFGSRLIPFTEKDEIESLEEGLVKYTLKIAQEFNPSVDNVHIIAFNKV